MKEIKIDKKTKVKLKKYVDLDVDEEKVFPLPKYTTQFFNLISSNAQATRPKYVGQMSDIIPEFINEFYEANERFPEWKDWQEYYLNKNKEHYEAGFKRFKEYIKFHLEAMEKIINDDEYDLARNWYDKFLMIQNFKGFQFEQFIFLYIKKETIYSDSKRFKVRKAKPEEESKKIDIIIEHLDGSPDIMINIKPHSSYSRMSGQKHNIVDEGIIVITYEKSGDDIIIRFEDEDYYNKLFNKK